jgi:ADP-ribose pyrophosphatase YjhB (NUDIX family)
VSDGWTLCAGAVILDDEGRLLLVRRGHAPYAGSWSLPSGRAEPGESARQAARREVIEETGLDVDVGELLGVVFREDAAAGLRYEIHDFAARVVAGTAHAADDADELGWFTPQELIALPTSPGLLSALRDFGVLAAGL